ncbi:MAG: hypothetical protein ABI120_01065 [Gemmatimonadaceae bacterium]
MMPDRLTFADTLHDAKRARNPRKQIVQRICLVVFVISLKLLNTPTTSLNVRIALVTVTAILAIASVIEWGQHEKQMDEYLRAVSRDAHGIAFRVTFYALWFMFMLDIGFGLPLSAHLPWGLPALGISWRGAAAIPLFAYSIAFVLNSKMRRRP